MSYTNGDQRKSQDGWTSVLSSKSSRETLEEKYTDIKYVIQEEPTTVILPVDSSLHSEQCLQFYIRYIHKIGNKVCVLYVSEDYVKIHSEDPSDPEEPVEGCLPCCRGTGSGEGAVSVSSKVVHGVGASPGILKELEHEDKMKCQAFKKKVKSWFRTNGVMFEFHRLVSNDVPKTIVQFTKKMQGNMVVMGARRLTAFQSAFMSSISKKVTSLSEVPVLMVKAPVEKRTSTTAIN